MRSFFLSVFCLGKDVLNRWRTHFSGALARIFVVFFLALTAMIVLSSFIVSEKVVAAEIERTGGKIVFAAETFFGENAFDAFPLPLISPPAGTRVSVFDEVFAFAKIGDETYPIFLYDAAGARFFPEAGSAPGGVFFFPKSGGAETAPAFQDAEIAEFPVPAKTLSPEGRETLAALCPAGAVFVPECSFAELKFGGFTRQTVFEAPSLNPETVRKIERAARERVRLDKRQAFVRSSLKFLERLERIRADQGMWRLAIPLGIVFIIGVLLISISSIEFRQNEYVYALMNSFGVNRALLVASFVAENALLVFGAFAAAVAVFFRCLPLLVAEAFKVGGNVTLEPRELAADFNIIAGALCVCVALAVVPVATSAFREIGKVLK